MGATSAMGWCSRASARGWSSARTCSGRLRILSYSLWAISALGCGTSSKSSSYLSLLEIHQAEKKLSVEQKVKEHKGKVKMIDIEEGSEHGKGTCLPCPFVFGVANVTAPRRLPRVSMTATSSCIYLLYVHHIWVCLKIGYIPNYSHLIGIMISKTIGFRGTLFSDTPTIICPWSSITKASQKTSLLSAGAGCWVERQVLAIGKLGTTRVDVQSRVDRALTLWLCQNSYWKWPFISIYSGFTY